MSNKECHTCNTTNKCNNHGNCLITVLSHCVKYTGGFLTNLGFGFGTDLTTALIKINDAISNGSSSYTFSNQGFII